MGGWAVVGASPDPSRASHDISRTLIDRGYDVVPVHPEAEEVHGIPCSASLAEAADADRAFDVVDIFRRSSEAGVHVDEAIEVGAKAVWMQLDVIDEEAAERARSAGLLVVMDHCPKIEIGRLDPPPPA